MKHTDTTGTQAPTSELTELPPDVVRLLQPWTGPYGGVPPWSEVHPEAFVSAFERAFAMAQQDIEAIVAQSESPTFDNTLVRLEGAARPLNRLQTLFSVHASNLNVGPLPDIQKVVMPRLAEHEDRIIQNEELFRRIATLHQAQDASLTVAQQRLLNDRYRNFVRNGAQLSSADKQTLSQINQRLATLFAQFSQNVLDDEERYVTWIKDATQLRGLPQSLIDAMANAAKTRGTPESPSGSWAITNTRSSVEPVLTYAQDRGLREQVWRTYYSRGDHGDDHDNNSIIAEILRLRLRRARLLGYATHAHWRLEPQMAKKPEAAMDLMMQVWSKGVARVREEVADMQRLADEEQAGITIEPWDYRYYAEKVRQARYDLDFNLVKPYLQLEKLREGMHWCAGELFGLQFRPVHDVPVFHPDVRVWEVLNAQGKHVGLWYLDPYARTGKRSGAWMSAYRDQENMGSPISPIVSNNSNFIPASPGEAVLISWDDAQTLFHEFGHALHGLLSQVQYPSQAGTSVARDYVEFPSQLNEHWLSTPEVLQRFAVHVETGAPLPQELLDKIQRAAKFNQGFGTVEFLASALIDMKLHLETGDVDPDAFEKKTLAELGMPREIVMRHRTPQFSHIFSGDAYSAGYYSYLWSDTLTADAAEAFEKGGGFFDPSIARSLHDHILSVGDTIDPADGFRAFRGRDVDTSALFRKRGL